MRDPRLARPKLPAQVDELRGQERPLPVRQRPALDPGDRGRGVEAGEREGRRAQLAVGEERESFRRDRRPAESACRRDLGVDAVRPARGVPLERLRDRRRSRELAAPGGAGAEVLRAVSDERTDPTRLAVQVREREIGRPGQDLLDAANDARERGDEPLEPLERVRDGRRRSGGELRQLGPPPYARERASRRTLQASRPGNAGRDRGGAACS
jgi:hypothetical protein